MNRRLQGIGMTSLRTRQRLVRRLEEQGITHAGVLQAILETPRHIFIEDALASRAYEDTALPIGFNQTISQPYVVARMTELLLEYGPLDKVLEIGTGSGYQTAILAKLIKRVYSVERIQPLQERARLCFDDLNIRNIRLQHADGARGWPEYAPFDGIIVTAAPSELPRQLLDQLAKPGTMVLPVGGGSCQTLERVTRNDTGIRTEKIEPVSFVPFLTGVI